MAKSTYFFNPQNGKVYTSYLRGVVYLYGMVLFRYHYNVKLIVKHNIRYYGIEWYKYADAGKVTFSYNLIY